MINAKSVTPVRARFVLVVSDSASTWPPFQLCARSVALKLHPPPRQTFSQHTRELRLRVVARPDRPVVELLVRLGLDLPTAPKTAQNKM